MTSIGVISSAVIRINRLKDVQRQDYPETAPFKAEGVVGCLENVKELLMNAYKLRKEEEAEVEIKEVVRLSYEIVNVIVDTLDQDWTKGRVKKLKDLEERLKGVQDKLSNKINPPSPASEVTSSTESSAGSSQSKKAGPETKLKGDILGIQRKVVKFVSDKLGTNTQKSTAGSGSDSDALLRSKTLVKTESTAGLDSGSDSDPLVGSKPPVITESTAGLGSGSDSNPLVRSKPPLTTQSTTGLESQVENLEIAEHKSPSTTSLGTLMESKASDLEPKPETSSSKIQILGEENKSSLMDEIKKVLTSKKPETREVYIVGKSGVGKSTLARNLYVDPDIRKPQGPFDVFGWVTLGHNFQIKEVLQLLLQQLQEQQLDTREMNETELIAEIFSAVHNKSYLLVLDDVGSVKDWESISLALPLTNSTRVIITTSSDDFSSSPHYFPITGLTRAETLALLNKEAKCFGSKIGDAIYNISGGLPLYITILGKALEPEADNLLGLVILLVILM